MANPLTGDFEAVLQISAGTLNRLLATMHQNGFADPGKPCFPHVTYFRIGNHEEAEGERGSVAAQIGVPRVELIHGARDRFRIEVPVRARYRADPGSLPLADVIHGIVHAEYRFHDIDPSCWGWQRMASEYVWMRVIERSVSFEGTMYNESNEPISAALFNGPAVRAQVVRYLVALLKTQFAPTPQRIGPAFRRMRSLVFGSGPTDGGIVIPFGLNGPVPAGNLASVQQLFLEGRDFGLAVSQEYIIAAIQPRIDPLIGLHRQFHVHGDAGVGGGLEIDYHVQIGSGAAEWLGPLPGPFFSSSIAMIRIRIEGGGWASRLYRSGVYNIGPISINDLRLSFTVEQLLTLSFDPFTEQLSVAQAGAPIVGINYGGPFAGEVKGFAHTTVSKQFEEQLATALAQAQGLIHALTAPHRKQALIDQLRQIDGAASARFDQMVARVEGVVLLGRIPLTHRHSPQVLFAKNESADGYDAIESWIPGGRVENFHWTWSWYTSLIETPPGSPGTSSQKHNFVLRRPYEYRSKFGLAMGVQMPLPGLDGNGRVCLQISGTRVDHVTGELVPVRSTVECVQFGYAFKLPYEIGPYQRVCDALLGVGERGSAEVGLLNLSSSESAPTGSNTLVLYLDRSWNEASVSVLTSALDLVRCKGIGLLVVLLFRDGVASASDIVLQSRLRRLSSELPAPLLVAEDVLGGWSKALALKEGGDEPAWRLLKPDGVVSWLRDGCVEAESLAKALESRLVAAAPAEFTAIRPTTRVGGRFIIDLVVRPCPPVPLARPGTPGLKLVFVQKDRSSSLVQVRRLRRENEGEDPPFIVVVLDRATPDEAEAFRTQMEVDWPVFPDPDGAIARGAGVPMWPAIFVLDELGTVTRYELGVSAGVGDHATPTT